VAYDFASDLDTIFNTDEFAENATYIRQGYPSASIRVHFSEETVDVEEEDEIGFSLPAPQAFCMTYEVPNAARGDKLIVQETTYHVQEARPDGAGLTLLILSKDA